MVTPSPSIDDKCPLCAHPLKAVETTATGRKLQRCSEGSWNSQTKTTEGCAYVKWINDPPTEIDEICPKCGAKLIMQTTRMGKKMKKCSAGGWDKETKKSTGCDYVDWGDKAEKLAEDCPNCGEKLVLQTTASGKKLKKCSTAGWDREKKMATGCTFVQWMDGDRTKPAARASAEPNGDETAPEFPL